MNEMNIKTAIPTLLKYTDSFEYNFIRKISEKERTACGTPEKWSAKDIIAHIAAWKSHAAEKLKLLAKADSGSIKNVDINQFNEATFKEHQQLQWDVITKKSSIASKYLVEQFLTVPADILLDDTALDWPDGPVWWLPVIDGFSHPIQHFATYFMKNNNRDYAIEIQKDALRQLALLNSSFEQLENIPEVLRVTI